MKIDTNKELLPDNLRYIRYVTPRFTAFIDIVHPEGEPRRTEDTANAAWQNNEGIQVGTIKALIQLIETSTEVGTIVLDNITVGKGSFYVELKPTEPWFTELPEGGLAQIRRIRDSD